MFLNFNKKHKKRFYIYVLIHLLSTLTCLTKVKLDFKFKHRYTRASRLFHGYSLVLVTAKLLSKSGLLGYLA